MSRIGWAAAPSLRTDITVPEPPQIVLGEIPDRASPEMKELLGNVRNAVGQIQEYLTRSHTALTQLAASKEEVETFLDDVLDAIKAVNRDGLGAIAAVTGTADATYSANEQTLLNDLTNAVNDILTNLQE